MPNIDVHILDYLRLLEELQHNPTNVATVHQSLIHYDDSFQSILNNCSRQDTEMVVARYQENLTWCRPYASNVTVYNKGSPFNGYNMPGRCRIKTLPNIGRESHTYLYHIITRWDTLADWTFFTQGSVSKDHFPFPIPLYLLPKKRIKLMMNLWSKGISFVEEKGGYLQHTGKWKREKISGMMRPSSFTFQDWWEQYVRMEKPSSYSSWKWSHGALFSISRDLIRRHDKKYYMELLSSIPPHRNPEEGHYFERSWYYIFYQGQMPQSEIS